MRRVKLGRPKEALVERLWHREVAIVQLDTWEDLYARFQTPLAIRIDGLQRSIREDLK